ncbi:twin-arginine translocase subunit TatB [Pseudomonas sp. G11-1]|uniref:Sec-independent protein translocase protein TatB n=1 Tax=Halopseudomonas bauzanensis TaxID=653930 RepID=A0A4U0YKH3_9GAMM|nr:Sec-independent protein translocase protein TatB [Halopseudomonas bauzanensis]MCO5786737.1 twin-arginine translocase subunit TatB [Pseudomonas sp. G11-1]MCO5789963.1 twin-arginine translocase subunit TatB [Pseudomonas sp. G11-2]TKA92630.1 twin-arginine translocase subunit TatB [Halopseudomonas bauzanensis]
MFDIGFLEMLVVAIVALLVLGPERLPGAVRMAGLYLGRIKRSLADVRSQVERELGADEIRQTLHNEKIMADLAKKKPGESNVKRNITATADETRPEPPEVDTSAPAEPTPPVAVTAASPTDDDPTAPK